MDQIRPGDIIAFGGRGFISWLIKWKTRSSVSHVGIVLRTDPVIELIESTTLTKRKGVVIRPLAERVENYAGEVWWLSLSDDTRARLDVKAMADWLQQQDGKDYDLFQAIMSAIIIWTFESTKTLFCSELCAGGFEAGGIWSGNSSEQTPKDIVNMDLYKNIVQLRGEPKILY